MFTTLAITIAGWLFSIGSQAVSKKFADDAAKQKLLTDARTAFLKAQSDLLSLHKDSSTTGGAA